MERHPSPGQLTGGADRQGRGAFPDRLPVPGKAEAGVAADGDDGNAEGAAAAAVLAHSRTEDAEETSSIGRYFGCVFQSVVMNW